MIFDTGQPHGVIRRGSNGFNAADFAPEHDNVQIFLTWELPIEDAHVGQALKVAFDIDPAAAQQDSERVCVNGAPATVCPDSGRWCQADQSPMS